MTRFAAALVVFAGAPTAPAAPVPKGAENRNVVPDLNAMLGAVEQAVKERKWPAEAEVEALTGTARLLFDRALKAAERKARRLPVDFDRLEKLTVTAELTDTLLCDKFVVAGSIRVGCFKNAMVFASGDVTVTAAINCVVVGRNVRVAAPINSLIVATEQVSTDDCWRGNGIDDDTVLVAGHWLRTTDITKTVCHVLHPTGKRAPGEAVQLGNDYYPAIRCAGAQRATFLNDKKELRATFAQDCDFRPQKEPIAKWNP